MEIRSLEIDIDKNIFKINGKEIKETPIIASLPGPDGWALKKVFNQDKHFSKEGCDKLEISYMAHIKSD